MRSIFALALLGSLAACAYPISTQTAYTQAAIEQPQHVDFFYGTLVGVRRTATLEFGTEPGVGATLGLSPYLAGIHLAANGPSAGVRFSGGFVNVLVGGSVANLPTTEYTVLLDTGINPPDPYLDPRQRTAAVIVVQNDLPDRYPADVNMSQGERVVVRVVGNTGRVMRDPVAPPPPPPPSLGGEGDGLTRIGNNRNQFASATNPGDPVMPAELYQEAARRDFWRRSLASVAPMPVPLSSASGAGYYPPVQDTGYHPHWVIPTF